MRIVPKEPIDLMNGDSFSFQWRADGKLLGMTVTIDGVTRPVEYTIEESDDWMPMSYYRLQMQRSAGNVIDEMIELENETVRRFWVNPKPVDL